MGPRLCSRGDLVVNGRIMKFAGELQWGRGFVAAETCVARLEARRVAEASMGPRLCSRGDRPPRAGGVGGMVCFNGAAAL